VIVVDTNVIAYLLLPGDQTEAARAALGFDAAWAAPLLWRSEFRNVLALYLRQRHLTVADALEVQSAAEEIMAGREYTVESAAVLPLAAASGRSAYDCEFVAVARALDVPFVTSDRQLLASFPETAVALSSFASDA
jgi:predicted nucleic acid-binding protein